MARKTTSPHTQRTLCVLSVIAFIFALTVCPNLRKTFADDPPDVRVVVKISSGPTPQTVMVGDFPSITGLSAYTVAGTPEQEVALEDVRFNWYIVAVSWYNPSTFEWEDMSGSVDSLGNGIWDGSGHGASAVTNLHGLDYPPNVDLEFSGSAGKWRIETQCTVTRYNPMTTDDDVICASEILLVHINCSELVLHSELNGESTDAPPSFEDDAMKLTVGAVVARNDNDSDGDFVEDYRDFADDNADGLVHDELDLKRVSIGNSGRYPDDSGVVTLRRSNDRIRVYTDPEMSTDSRLLWTDPDMDVFEDDVEGNGLITWDLSEVDQRAAFFNLIEAEIWVEGVRASDNKRDSEITLSYTPVLGAPSSDTCLYSFGNLHGFCPKFR